MGELYKGKIICPYCESETEFHYAESCGMTSDICKVCKKTFDIEMKINFKGVKI